MNPRICIIPARGGSTRIPRKNVKLFHGQPIIAYSIEKARASGLFDRVVVTTDDAEIASVALSYGAEVYRRPPEYGQDEVGTQEVVRECLQGLGIGSNHEIVCCIYATVPLMNVHDLTRGFYILTGQPCTTFVFSVGYPELCDAGQFYWGWAYDFRMGTPLISPETRMVRVDASRVCDINTPKDWARAVKMYKQLEEVCGE